VFSLVGLAGIVLGVLGGVSHSRGHTLTFLVGGIILMIIASRIGNLGK